MIQRTKVASASCSHLWVGCSVSLLVILFIITLFLLSPFTVDCAFFSTPAPPPFSLSCFLSLAFSSSTSWSSFSPAVITNRFFATFIFLPSSPLHAVALHSPFAHSPPGTHCGFCIFVHPFSLLLDIHACTIASLPKAHFSLKYSSPPPPRRYFRATFFPIHKRFLRRSFRLVFVLLSTLLSAWLFSFPFRGFHCFLSKPGLLPNCAIILNHRPTGRLISDSFAAVHNCRQNPL